VYGRQPVGQEVVLRDGGLEERQRLAAARVELEEAPGAALDVELDGHAAVEASSMSVLTPFTIPRRKIQRSRNNSNGVQPVVRGSWAASAATSWAPA